MIVAGDQTCANAPADDGCVLLFKALDEVFVQIVAADDDRGSKPGVVENFSCLSTEKCEVARIEPNARQLLASRAQLPTDFNGVVNSLERIVGVHQEHGVIRQGFGKLT